MVLEKEDQYINMIFTPGPITAHPSVTPPRPKTKGNVAAARQEAAKRVKKNITGRVGQFRSSRKRT